jgi:hypothetical protein
MRKMTLRSYIDLLETEDRIRGHPYYKNAALKAIQVYLALAESPSAQDELEAALGKSFLPFDRLIKPL